MTRDDREELIRQQLNDLQTVVIRVDTNLDNLVRHIDGVVERLKEHSGRIDESAMDLARLKTLEIDKAVKTLNDWKSKGNLILGVSGFVGIGGFVSMVTLLIREFSK